MMTILQNSPDLLERRVAAIEESGWGERFRFLQPRNACMWVYLFLVALGARELYRLAAPTAEVFEAANLAAVGSAGFFCLLFLLFLHHFDRYERTPAALAVVAFVGGGIGATWAMALPGNGALMNLYAKMFGQAWATDWQAGLTAPFVEETAKGVVFVLLLGLAPRVIRTVYYGLIVGAFVGLGFQVLEDMLYGQNSAYQHFGVDQVASVLHTFVLRSATGGCVPRHVHRHLLCRRHLPRGHVGTASPSGSGTASHAWSRGHARCLGFNGCSG